MRPDIFANSGTQNKDTAHEIAADCGNRDAGVPKVAWRLRRESIMETDTADCLRRALLEAGFREAAALVGADIEAQEAEEAEELEVRP